MMTDDDYLNDDDIASIAKLGLDSETQSREALESIYTDNNTSHGQRDELQLDGPQAPFTLLSSWLQAGKTIKTDKYADKVYPLTKQQLDELERSLLKGFKPYWPIIINSKGDVLDGHHRLQLCRKHGIEPVYLAIQDFDKEIDEEIFVYESNIARRQMTKFQRLELEITRVDPLLAKKAEMNMKAGVTLSRNQERVHVDERIARKLVTSKDTVNKARQLINSKLFKEDEFFREEVRADTLRINPAHQQMRRAENRDKPKPPPPKGKYDILYVDPPWSYHFNGEGSPEDHYDVMSDEEIMDLEIPAADNAVLFLWGPYPKNEVVFDVIRSWGFEYRSKIIWVKDRIGTGHYVRAKHEELFICVKGYGLGVPAEQDRWESVISAERKEHSEKPEIFHEIIEKMYPRRTRIELFARGKPRDGWTTWGFEVVSSSSSDEN